MQDKSAEEILRIVTVNGVLKITDARAVQAMKEYSTQQNASINKQLEEAKELLKEFEQLVESESILITVNAPSFSKRINNFLNQPK